MKKNNFLGGLGAKLALAVVAVAAMFTSCSNEDISINVKAVDATFQILPTVISDGVDVTAQATITYSDNSTGKYSATEIQAGSVVVTAAYNGLSASKTVEIPHLTAAKSQSTTVLFILNSKAPETTTEYTLVLVSEGEAEIVSTISTENLDNNSDYAAKKSFDYEAAQDIKVTDVKVYGDADKATIEAWAKAQLEGSNTVTKSFEVEVAAQSRKVATVSKTATQRVYNVVATTTTKSDETAVAVVYVTESNVSVAAGADVALSSGDTDHEGNTDHTGNTGHGDDSNAGGSENNAQ
jgi:hypothetical protein